MEDDGTVRFAIKPLGDYTKALRDGIAIGDRLKLEGGYGHFNHRRGSKKQIWLAGGIGVTPFLAMAGRLKGDEGQDIHMVYCVRDRSEAIGLDTFQTQADKLSNFSFTLHDSKTGRQARRGKACRIERRRSGGSGPLVLRAAIAAKIH